MNRKIRILQITHDLQVGGLQQVVVNICRTIDRDKFEVVVLCLRELGELVTDVEKLGIEVIQLPKDEGKTDYFSFLKVATIIKNKKIDVIHTHNTQPFFDGTLAAIKAGVRTLIHTDHARQFPDKKRYMFAEWLVSKYAYKVVGVSEHTSNNLIKYEKISPKKITTITNGIDERVYDISINVNDKKQQLGISNNHPVIGLGVRLTEQKGISILLQSMKSILDKFPDAALVIAGDGNYKGELEKQVKELKLQDNVVFLGVRNDIAELLKLFNLYVLPSYSEGLPMVLLEAMASGCPIVSTDVGGVSMAVKDNVTGLLVAPKNTKELTHAMLTILENENLKDEFVRQGKILFEKKFSAKSMMAQYEALYLSGFDKYNGGSV